MAENKGKNKDPRKWRHLQNFTLGEEGKYAYSGSLMACRMEEGTYKSLCTKLLLITAGILALFIAAGCFPATGMEGNAFVLIPYALAVILGALLIYSILMMRSSGPLLREYQYEKYVYGANRRAALGLAACGAGLLGFAISIARKSFTGRGIGAMILAAAFFAGLLGFLYSYRSSRKIPWEKTSGDKKAQ